MNKKLNVLTNYYQTKVVEPFCSKRKINSTNICQFSVVGTIKS